MMTCFPTGVARQMRVPQRPSDIFRVPLSGPPRPEPLDDGDGGVTGMEGESPVLGGMAALGMAVLGMLVLSSMASAAPSFSPEDDPYSGVVVARPAPPLPTKLRQAVLLDPQVAEASARACQMAHRLGLARNKGRPQVSASIR